MGSTFDLVIRSGQIADGLGSPLFEADIGVENGRISAIGPKLAAGKQELDAHGLLVCPGWVDLHTHYDGQAMWDCSFASSSWNGVTTVVMGNCGVGFAPVHPHHRKRLVDLMEGVEDIPGVVLDEGLDWQWESFAEYLDALERIPHEIDYCAQLAHGPLRVYVMGERALQLEQATDSDIAAMRQLAKEAMQAGAIGFSTSRSINHKSRNGDPTPSLRAAEAELTGIALGLKDAGRGVLSLLSDFDAPDLDSEFDMLTRVMHASGRPLSFSLLQKHRAPYQEDWKRLLEKTHQAVQAGLEMRCQVAPRSVGMLLGVQATRTPFSLCPSFKTTAAMGFSERLQWLGRPEVRAQLLAEIEQLSVDTIIPFERMFALGDPPNYEPDQADSIASRAAAMGVPAASLAYGLMMENNGKNFLYAPFANYQDFNLDACGAMLAAPNTIPGLSDGGAHVGIISDASFPTFMLTHWGRDRAEGKFDLSWLVKRHTSDTARAAGLLDRGVLQPGMKADLNIIDMSRLELAAPTMHYDLPAGGKRLLQPAKGYVATLVSGVAIYREGVATGALPGQLVRGPQAKPVVNAKSREHPSC